MSRLVARTPPVSKMDTTRYFHFLPDSPSQLSAISHLVSVGELHSDVMNLKKYLARSLLP